MFCFAGFGMDRLRCEQAMKTTGRRNPNHWAAKLSNRANGAERHNRSCSTTWAVKVEKFQPREKFFFLTFPFIEQLGPFACTRRAQSCVPNFVPTLDQFGQQSVVER